MSSSTVCQVIQRLGPLLALEPISHPASPANRLWIVDSTLVPVRPSAPRYTTLGESRQPDVRRDGASPPGEQGAHLADGARDGRAVHSKPAGQYIVSGAMAQVHQGGQQTVDKDKSVLRPGSYGSSLGPSRQASLMLFVPQRPYLRDEFKDRLRR